VFFPAKLTAFPALPQLSGPKEESQRVLDHYRSISELLVADGLVVKFLALSRRGAWIFTLSNGIRVLLGHRRPLQRVRAFASVYPVLVAPKAKRIQQVDMRYTNRGLAIRWKNS